MPNWCPKCGHIMGRNNLDQKYWVIHKMCFKCSIAFQTQMKLDGSWEQYQIRYLLNNLINTCEEAIQFYQHLKTHSARSVLLNQEGETQDWDVSGIQQFNNQLDQFIKEIELFKANSIEQAQTEIKLLNESKLDQQVLQSEVFVRNTTDNIVDSNNDDEN